VDLLVLNGALEFAADDGTHGQALWKTDGTADGTALVKEMGFCGFYGGGCE
jgi:ELWxxDGT repeat protein